jgi:RimJ/RimL family protein N-acetyltransferase
MNSVSSFEPTKMIETRRCVIRKFERSDLDALFLVLNDPDVMEYIEEPFSYEKTQKFLEENGLVDPARVYAVELKESKELIGHVIFHQYENESYEVGWILSKRFWGQGIADEVTKALIDHARKRSIYSLVIECAPEQTASQRIAKNNGFVLKDQGYLVTYELVL